MRKHRKAPPEQKLDNPDNTPMWTKRNGEKAPMTPAMIEGRKRGGFQKGQSGNPKGRPPVAEELKVRAGDMSVSALEKVFEIAMEENPRNVQSQLKAAEFIVNLVLPKAAAEQKIEIEVNHSTTDFLLDLAKKRGIATGHIIDVTPPETDD